MTEHKRPVISVREITEEDFKSGSLSEELV